MKQKTLRRKIGTAVLSNPVIAASGTFGYGNELTGFFSLKELGGFVTKTITPKARTGNPPPRIYDLGFGVINSIGLENPGLAAFKKKYMDFLRKARTNVFISIFAETIDGFRTLIRAFRNERISGFELNLSCPNIKGHILSADKTKVAKVVNAIRPLTRKALIAKLTFSPQINEVAQALGAAGIDAITLINTLPAMVLDTTRRTPFLGNIYGGLSGPCIKPVALRCVHEVSRTVDVPIIGCGGIMSADDAIDFLASGAYAVQVGTATLITPTACRTIIKEMAKRL